jgi:DNA-binding transcriptional LysR family regulator
MPRDINVDQIKKLMILDLVAKTGSLKKAAQQLRVTPSAVSQAVTSLERSLGKPLLIRDRALATATQDAVSILDVVRPAFEAFDRLRDLNQIAVPKLSWMNFGTYESLAIDLLPGLLHSLRQKLPHLRLGLRVSRTAQLLSMVRKGELCSALITEVDDLGKFYVKDVTEDRLGFYVSRVQGAGLGTLEKFGLGCLSPGYDGHPLYYSRFMRQFEIGRPTLLSDSFEALRAAAVSGAITAVLPRRVALRTDDLVEIFPKIAHRKARENTGRHKIYIVSQANCDREEADFIAFEAQRILARS